MLARLRQLLAPTEGQVDPVEQEQLSAALLLVEMARADYEVAEVERETIVGMLAERYKLAPAQAEHLVGRALSDAEGATSLYGYVKTLNGRLDYSGKCELVEMLWQVANADGHVDAYEEHRLRKLAGLLYVSDQDYVRAKLKVLDARA